MCAEFKVGLLGAGMMGAEIALSFAASGYPVIMKDMSLEIANRGKARLDGILDKAIRKGRCTAADKELALTRITPTDQYKELGDASLVIEAIVEDFNAKKEVLTEVEAVCTPDCVIATNTSSIPITKLAACLGPERRDKFAGAHFFSPAFVMQLVEIVPGLETDEATVTFLMDLCRKIGKTPIRVKDVTGFVVNRILHAMWIEACRLLEEGVADPKDIDTG
ncbi:MAG: 3-hydroxyacyl-CoA dehydrogenase family protein [Deltaproteobacteria bacterium]